MRILIVWIAACEFKVVDRRTQNVVCFPVAFLRQLLDIDWVGVLAKNSAKESILGNVPPMFRHPTVTHLTLWWAASIDGGLFLLMHSGVAQVREVVQSQSP